MYTNFIQTKAFDETNPLTKEVNSDHSMIGCVFDKKFKTIKQIKLNRIKTIITNDKFIQQK